LCDLYLFTSKEVGVLHPWQQGRRQLTRVRGACCSDMLNNVGARGGNSTIFMNSSPGAMAELGTQMRTAFTQAAAGSQALSQSMKRE